MERGANGAGPATHPELVVDVLEVGADRGGRNEELPADLPVRQPLRNQTEDVELPLGQGGQVRPSLPARAQTREVGSEQREERTIALIEVSARRPHQLEVARMAARGRQPQLQLVLTAQRSHHG
jgi:hypothetical protein